MNPPIRLPLAAPLETRDSSASKDAKMVNCFLEKTLEGWQSIKRPGMVSAFQGQVGAGQGMVNFLGTLCSISGDVLNSYQTTTANTFTRVQANASWTPRVGHRVVAFQGKLWLMGGMDSTGTYLSDVYNSIDGVNWNLVTMTAPWGPRRAFELIVFNNVLYLIGGFSSTTFYGDVWSTSNGSQWNQIAVNAFPPRSSFGLTIFNNQLCVAGGYTSGSGTVCNDIWVSTNGASWSRPGGKVTCPWAARAGFGFASFNGMLIVLGGDLSYGLPGCAGDLWTSSDAINWTRVSSNPFGQLPTGVAGPMSWQSLSAEYYFPPTITLSGGGGSGAVAQCWITENDIQTGELPTEIGAAYVVGSGFGYSSAPTVTVTTSELGLTPVFLAYLQANGPIGDKRGFFVVDTTSNILYFFATYNGGANTNTSEIWSSTNGTTWRLFQSNPSYGNRTTIGLYYNSLWIFGGEVDTGPTYFNDVWKASSSSSYFPLLQPKILGQRFTFNQTSPTITNPLLFLKSTTDAYTFNFSVLTKISNSAYPTKTVPGIAYLDGSFYVMDPFGQIWGSGINNPSSWSALNMTPMQSEPSGGVALAKYANYLVAFGQWSIQFFYDNQNPAPASPLATNSTLTINIGCANGDSVVEMQNTVVWLGQTKDAGRKIYLLSNLIPTPISSPFVNRILQADNLSQIYAYATGAEGHDFYVLTLTNSAITLVYDFTSQQWSVWTTRVNQSTLPVTSISADIYGTVTASVPAHGLHDGDPVQVLQASDSLYNGMQNVNVLDLNTLSYQVTGAPGVNTNTGVLILPTAEGSFSGVAAANLGGNYYIQHATTGVIYNLNMGNYADDGVAIDMRVKTGLWDGGTKNWKTFPDITIVADVQNARALLRYTNDDYNTYSAYRSIDMSKMRQHITRVGRARRRAFEFRFTGNTPMRVKYLEFIPETGDY